MDRQMFAKGGAAFPDYSGDGQITQKDILMGRGVIPMQEGGMAPMMPPQGMPPMMPPSGAMMGAASGVPEEQAEAMGAQTMDTGAMQGMLAQVADNLENLDEVEDYEQVMNVMRGDNATLEDRYDELAGVVGPEDARQTPESVLALVQPVMMMAAVDQGIGGLAAEEMTAPVEGAMAEGIMSTVAPPPPAEMAPSMPPAGMGGPPPVNFNQGGLVRRGDNQPVKHFANGGVDFEALMPYMGPRVGMTPTQSQDLRAKIDAASTTPNANVASQGDGSRLRQLMDAQKEIYREYGLGDAASRTADLEEQKKLTQAQMLFDIAQTALTFAAPMQGEPRGLSPAERLAMAASSTKLPQTIGARAQQQLEMQKAAKKEERAIDLAALQSAETKLAAEVAATEARGLANIKASAKSPELKNLVGSDGVVIGTFNVNNSTEMAQLKASQRENPGSYIGTPPKPTTKGPEYKTVVSADGAAIGSFDVNSDTGNSALATALKNNPDSYVGTPKAPSDEKTDFQVVYNGTGKTVAGIGPYSYSKVFNINNKDDLAELNTLVSDNTGLVPTNMPTGPTPPAPISERDFFMKFGFSYQAFGQLSPEDQNFVRGLPVVTAKDFFVKFGMMPDEFKKLNESDQRYKLGLPTLTDNDYFTKFGMNKADFLALDSEVQNRLLGVTPKTEIKTDALGRLVDVTDPANPKVVWGTEKKTTPKVVKVTINGEEKYVDVNSEAWPAVQSQINTALKEQPGSATVTTVGNEVSPKGYLVDNKIVLSYDKGRTYVDANGKRQDIPSGAFPVSDTTTYEVHKNEAAKVAATQQLRDLDARILSDLTGAEGVTADDLLGVKNALAMARKGTGFYSNFTALLDGASSLIPGPIKPDWVTEFGRETQEARQYLRGVRVLGRSALVVNNRFPVAEMATVAELFPKPEAFLVDPDTEARKFIQIKQLAMQQYRHNLKQLEGNLAPADRNAITANNLEIQRLLSLLPGVNLSGDEDSGVSPEVMSGAQSIMQGAVDRGKQ
jgi:hypothetical protein